VVLPLKAKASHSKAAGIIVTSRGIALAIIDHAPLTPRLIHAQFYPCDMTEHVTVLAQLSKDHQLSSTPCHFVLNPDEYQFLQVEKPQVEKQELQSALRWHIKDLVDYHIDDVVLDYLTLPVDNMPLQVVATRKSVIQSRVDLLSGAHCQIASIDIAVQAARNLIDKVKSVRPDTSIGLLNLWDTNAKISVLLNHDLYINRLTNIGAESLNKVSEDDIDSQSIVDSLAVELQRTFDYYESYSRQAPVSQLIIMSNTRPIANLDEMIQARLGMDCQIITPSQFDALDIEITQQTTDLPDTCLMAIGGALRVET
jgi:MSHA biogenesis protein MshI